MSHEQLNDTHKDLLKHGSALVLGLGMSGYSVIRFLRKQGLTVRAMDSRMDAPNVHALETHFPEVSIKLGEFSARDLAQYSLIVISPGLNSSDPIFDVARSNAAEIIGDIELFIRFNKKPLIGITGSNGKSTVTALVGEVCAASNLQTLVAGNIGHPVLDALTDEIPYDIAVLELSSFQLETTRSVPALSVAILNLSLDHMDRYQSMGDYVLAKLRILRGAKRVILPRHEPLLSQVAVSSELGFFGLDEPTTANDFGVKQISHSRWLVKGGKRLMRLRDIPLLGLHNVSNVLAAFALVDPLGLALEDTVSAVKNFHGLPHRMETVFGRKGVTWVNDSKATNIGATVTALRSLETKVVLIAGGQGKGADFSDLKPAMQQVVIQVILLGEDAEKIAAITPDNVPVKFVTDMRSAVMAAGKCAREGCVVLLSPACASFDMYQSFEERGDDFKRCVIDWVEAQAA